jgi:hypothetical protein
MAAEGNLDFDELMQAVKESSRGRWFLEQFEARLRHAETAGILAAIEKLERVVSESGAASQDTALVSKARAAIASARREIAALDMGKAGLSEEARLFAKLAELAKSAFSDETSPTLNAGVTRALRLVDDLEQDFGVGAGTDYFTQDASVFEPESRVAAATSIPNARPAIVKTAIDATCASDPDAKSGFVTPPPSRVVIVRRSPEELMEVPLLPASEESLSPAA